jgi:hypothetical protein
MSKCGRRCGWFASAPAYKPYRWMFESPHRKNFFVEKNIVSAMVWNLDRNPSRLQLYICFTWVCNVDGHHSDHHVRVCLYFNLSKRALRQVSMVDQFVTVQHMEINTHGWIAKSHSSRSSSFRMQPNRIPVSVLHLGLKWVIQGALNMTNAQCVDENNLPN